MSSSDGFSNDTIFLCDASKFEFDDSSLEECIMDRNKSTGFFFAITATTGFASAILRVLLLGIVFIVVITPTSSFGFAIAATNTCFVGIG
jgi:hypothetical protein